MNRTDVLAEIDACCDRFEREWQQGHSPPSLADYLQGVSEDHRGALFRELLLLDIQIRSGRGLAVDWDDYHARFPDFSRIVAETRDSSGADRRHEHELRQAPGKPTPPLRDTLALAETGSSSQRVSASQDPADRLTIGRYRVIQLLGRGGQGYVYRAAHPALPIEVAIKIGRGRLNEADRQALTAEAEVLCSLDHPGIARVRDMDCDENGHPFLVLDFIRGQSMHQAMRLRAMNPDRWSRWVSEVADAVGYAHRRGVLHLDLKPANVVLDEHDQPRVIDFGMARLRHLWRDASDESDRVSGTPQYMSPEQARGIAAEIGTAADVFSLGAILFHAITGHPPIQGTTPLATLQRARESQIEWHLLDSAGAAGDARIRRLADLCRQAMAAEPHRRIESAEAFATAVRQATDEGQANGSKGRRWVVRTLATMASISLLSAGLWRFKTREPAPPPSKGVLIDRFEITHIGNSPDSVEFRDGLLRRRAALTDDDVQLAVAFTEPVYSYLLALNPDGQTQLCLPASDDQPQTEPSRELRFPEDADAAFGLTDGAGQQAFLVVASRSPLPPFRDWREGSERVSWPHPELVGNWVYRGGQLLSLGGEPLAIGNDKPLRQRGTVRRLQGGAGFQELCRRLVDDASDDVAGVTFEVLPR